LRELARGSSIQELQCAASERNHRRKALQEAHRSEERGQRGVTDEVAGSAYEALLGHLDLSPQHGEQMKKRGIAFEEALDLGYRTLPVDREMRIRLCEELLSDGYDLRGVPGFFQLPREADADAGRWCVGGTALGRREIRDRNSGRVWRVEGLLVPTCDELGRIVRLKLRNDPPSEGAPDWVVDMWPAKYMALSSKDRPGGAGAGIRLHYVGPADGGNFARALWVTEGEIKADIASMMLAARVVGVPGVGQCPELVIEAMRRGRYHRLLVAMDSEAKEYVQLAMARLCRLATQAGFEPLVVVWNGSIGKGIDDLLVAGGEWKAVPPEQWWGSLSKDERESVERRLVGVCVG
jgi:DNA primase